MQNRSCFSIVSVFFLIVCLAGVFFSAGCVDAPEFPGRVAVPEGMNATLEDVGGHVRSSLDAIGTDVRAVAAVQSGYVAGDPLLLQSVRDLYLKYPWAQYAVRYDRNGSVVAGYPFYGADTLYLGEVIPEDAFGESGYLLSRPNVNSAGMGIISVSVPVYSRAGEYDGYVCLEMYPWMLYQQVMRETGYPAYYVWLIDTEGTVFCSPDALAVGKNILTDSMYADCKAREIVWNASVFPEGAGVGYGFDRSYGYLVEKVFVWSMVSVGGKDVCVILSDPVVPGPVVFPAREHDLGSMREMTEEIYLYAQENGREMTLSVLNDPRGRFAVEDGAVFAFDVNGTLLADSVRGRLAGESVLDFRDGYGVETIKMLVMRNLQGGGYLPYCHPLYSEDGERTARLCLAYVLPMGEEWFAGVVQPFSAGEVPYPVEMRDEVLGHVMSARAYVEEFGKDAALAEFINPDGVFVREGIRLYALDTNGTILADGKRPYNVGKNGFFFTDRYGGSMSRLAVLIAKDGGGYLLSLHDLPNGDVRVVLQFIQMMDEGWLVGATVELGSVSAAA